MFIQNVYFSLVFNDSVHLFRLHSDEDPACITFNIGSVIQTMRRELIKAENKKKKDENFTKY